LDYQHAHVRDADPVHDAGERDDRLARRPNHPRGPGAVGHGLVVGHVAQSRGRGTEDVSRIDDDGSKEACGAGKKGYVAEEEEGGRGGGAADRRDVAVDSMVAHREPAWRERIKAFVFTGRGQRVVDGARPRICNETDVGIGHAAEGMVGRAIRRAVPRTGGGRPRIRTGRRAVPRADLDGNTHVGGLAGAVDRDFGVTDVEYDKRRGAEYFHPRGHSVFRNHIPQGVPQDG
jgi:hypothetical protein